MVVVVAIVEVGKEFIEFGAAWWLTPFGGGLRQAIYRLITLLKRLPEF